MSPWRISNVTYELKSLTNWRFAVESDQTFFEEISLVTYGLRLLSIPEFIFGSEKTFVREIVISYWKPFLVKKQTLPFCRNFIHVSFKVTFYCHIRHSMVYFCKFCCIWDLLATFYFCVKIWTCCIWVEIFVNFGI